MKPQYIIVASVVILVVVFVAILAKAAKSQGATYTFRNWNDCVAQLTAVHVSDPTAVCEHLIYKI